MLPDPKISTESTPVPPEPSTVLGGLDLRVGRGTIETHPAPGSRQDPRKGQWECRTRSEKGFRLGVGTLSGAEFSWPAHPPDVPETLRTHDLNPEDEVSVPDPDPARVGPPTTVSGTLLPLTRGRGPDLHRLSDTGCPERYPDPCRGRRRPAGPNWSSPDPALSASAPVGYHCSGRRSEREHGVRHPVGSVGTIPVYRGTSGSTLPRCVRLDVTGEASRQTLELSSAVHECTGNSVPT